MKKMFLLFMLSFISVAYSIQGLENMNKTYNYGYQKYGKESLDSIQVNGTVILEGTKVSGLVHVNGCLEAEETEINTLQVNGQTELHNSVIRNTSVINGSITADNTKFQNALSVASQRIVLRMCTVESLTIREVIGFTGKQVVDLRSGTKVLGPIIVESGNGEIWISSNSEISEEQVSGAQIYRK